MTQPKLPPLSIRLAPEMVERVETWAKANGCTRNAAIARLLLTGLSADDPGLAFRVAEGRKAIKAMAEREAERQYLAGDKWTADQVKAMKDRGGASPKKAGPVVNRLKGVWKAP